MRVIEASNVSDALWQGMVLLAVNGVQRSSRNGTVLLAPWPVTTVYKRPRERVLFGPARDANPFFHLMEALWMLDGRDDVALPAQYVKRMTSFSDDGKTLHGAYGRRWRRHFPQGSQVLDQLMTVVMRLRENPEDRRCVIAMWDPTADLGREGRDLPCNTHMYPSVNKDGELDLTVCCRSNDAIWGAYGANAVHFSVFQEVLAALVGVPVGRYWQVSNNFHAYLDVFSTLADKPRSEVAPDLYEDGDAEPFPMFTVKPDIWFRDLKMFLSGETVLGMDDKFFRRVAIPMEQAHKAYRTLAGIERFDAALDICEQIRASDWRIACEEWLRRRRAKFLETHQEEPGDQP